jgi:hypothetical protein
MSKQIVVNGKNGAENVRLSRLATRQSNLIEDRKSWQELAQTPCSTNNPAYTSDKKPKKLSKLMKMGDTLVSRIVAKYADDYGISDSKSVTRDMIADLAKEYLTWPEKAQMNVCRDPSRQSIDEEVQVATLAQNLKDVAKVDKLPNGEKTLYDGRIITKDDKKNENIKLKKNDSRSIDIRIVKDDVVYYVFAKYTKDAGSGQGLQAGEAETFIENAVKYTAANNDTTQFVVLLDGLYEAEIPAKNKELNNGRVYYANCEKLIDLILAA